jgi:hypothetical protein
VTLDLRNGKWSCRCSSSATCLDITIAQIHNFITKDGKKQNSV